MARSDDSARRVYACLTAVTQAISSQAYAVESVLHERLPDLRDVFETFFRVQETIHDMLESLPASEVAPDTVELDALTHLLDKWLSLTATVDSDIARYPVWRHIQEFIEDLEPENPRLWSRRIQPLLHQLQRPVYAPPRYLNIQEPTLSRHPLPPYPPHWIDENTNYC